MFLPNIKALKFYQVVKSFTQNVDYEEKGSTRATTEIKSDHKILVASSFAAAFDKVSMILLCKSKNPTNP